MTAVWASCHEDLVSDGVVSPPLCDPMVDPALGAVRAQCNSPGSAVDAGLDAAARALLAPQLPAPAGRSLRPCHMPYV
jgi:hypothetical protein